MADFAKKVAIVTGAGSGIGARTAEVLAGKGATVVVADLSQENGERTVESVLSAGGTASYHPLDVREEESVRDLIRRTVDGFGRIDLLHNNAAATHLYAGDDGIGEIDATLWDDIMSINLRGVMLGCKHVLPVMVGQRAGAIVNMSSTRAVAGASNLAAYGTSKAAVEALTRYVATAYGPQGVRCNAIRPGLIATPQSLALHDDGLRSLRSHIPLPYTGTPDDIAHAVAFLSSDDARFITGQTLCIDGGMLATQPFYSAPEVGSA